ncbi:MAG: RimK family alpha-L-glutamate ligase [Candidatus Nanoarchaeia archaeon]|nr:RimK family alpha-L-glutamate ligase [Candidatus Nanoarchaeia archaeon]
MRLAIISLNGKSSKEIAEFAKEHFSEVSLLDIRKITINSTPNGLKVSYENQPLEKYDCVYMRGSYKYALLQKGISKALKDICYLPIQPEAFIYAHDKFLTTLPLEENKVEFPGTHLCANIVQAKKLLEKVNYPIIIKIPSGTQGKGVMFANSAESAKSILDALDIFKQPYIIQEYIETEGTDIRLIVGGDKILASMKRVAPLYEIRANIHAGGVGEKFDPPEEIKNLAIRASRAINADLCAIDILQGGIRNYVLEINLSPGLQGISEANKTRVAKDVALFLAEKTREYIKNTQDTDFVNILNETEEKREILTNLKIKEGVIKLPQVVTKLTKFIHNDEVTIITEKDRLTIKKA